LCTLFYISFNLEMCFNEIHICVRLWQNLGAKSISVLSLCLVKGGGYDFPIHVMAAGTVACI
jgi:hypothetical protein